MTAPASTEPRRGTQMEWHKSSYSSGEGSCVEVAEGATTLVRDTQNRPLGHIEFPAAAWTELLAVA